MRARNISIVLTILIAAIVFLWLRFAYIHLSERIREWPPRHDGEVTLVEDEFFDVITDIPVNLRGDDAPSQVFNEQPASNLSTPAPESGHETVDRGPAAEAPSIVTSKQPSPLKTPATEPKKNGPSAEELKQQEEEARRKANSAMNSAFNRTKGENNTANNGKTPGNSGSPSGKASGINGTGSGTVGGGWFMPTYAKVPASITGSIRLMVKIDKAGNVMSVTFIGGDAPAATDPALRRAVESEVRSRRFTRGNSPAPDQATAYITYRFL